MTGMGARSRTFAIGRELISALGAESENRRLKAVPPMYTLFYARTLSRSEAALLHSASGVF